MTRLAWLALGALPSCYLSHGLSPELPADAGPRPDAAILVVDAPLDAPAPRCALVVEEDRFVTDTAYAAHAPELGWDGERIGLVVFESDGTIPHPIVSATRIAPDLSSVEPLRVVGEEAHAWGEAAWDPRVGFGVCWSGDPGGRTRTLFRRRDARGAPSSPLVEVDAMGGACEGLARGVSRWAAVYRHGAAEVNMRLSVFDDAGAVVGAPIDLDRPTPSPGRSAFLAADGDGFVVVVPFDGVGLLVQRVLSDGSVGASAMIDAPRARHGAVAVASDGTIGLLIRDGMRERGGLRFVRLDRALSRLPGETLLVVEGRGVRHPRLVTVPDGWAALWVEQADSVATAAVLSHLAPDGTPREPRRVIVDGQNSDYGGPALLAHEASLYAAVARPPEGAGAEQVHLTRLACAAAPDRCDAQDARSSGDDCGTLLGFAWHGSACEPVLCGCLGTECDRIAPLEAECLADHVGC